MCFNKLLFFLASYIVFCVQQVHAQKQHEIGLISDNDLYVSYYLDEYFTNGLELYYKTTSNTKYDIFNKKIKSISVRQNIYNPQEHDIPVVYNQERPYAGYLFANYDEQFINHKNILKLGVTLGVTNQKSGGEWAQNFIHKFYSIDASSGWNTQVKERYAVGFFANYTRSIFYKKQSAFNFLWINKTTLNTVISNIGSGFAFRLNFLKNGLAPITNSSFLGTALQVNQEKWIKESYLGFKTLASYQIHDYTLTGELDRNPSQKQFHLKPWTWLNDIGLYWNFKYFNMSYHVIFKTRELKEMKTKITRYGSLQFSYKF